MSLLLFTCFSFFSLIAQPTTIVVRVKAVDAKFVGSSMCGAQIVIRDVNSDSIISTGYTQGTTGDTDAIMKEPVIRGESIITEATASFKTTIDLVKPQLVNIEVYSPLNNAGTNIKAERQIWLIPGKDIIGDGIVIEVSGFVVDLLSPYIHHRYPLSATIEVKANVVMMCGCPVRPGGLWDADKFEINAVFIKEGKPVKELRLSYTGESNLFANQINDLKEGGYQIYVYAYDPITGNTGVDQTSIFIRLC